MTLLPLSSLELPLLETPAVLRAAIRASRQLAELKGAAASIPNQGILISTLGLQEAKDSSAIENIVTTHNELLISLVADTERANAAAKEVRGYARALRVGFERVQETGLITSNLLIDTQTILESHRAGFRKLPGTALRDQSTGAVVYTPPQEPDAIVALMTDLERFINDAPPYTIDPLVRMAVIHHQFESIHPFYDGNGRTGRILNVLFLVQHGLLDIPVLYLSRYIVQTKAEYYRLLQQVRDNGVWEPWLLYMLTAIENTAADTLRTISDIKMVLHRYKHHIRERLPFYSQDLINSLFVHPYTRIDYLMSDLGISRPTAKRYLDALVREGLLTKHRLGRVNYFINIGLLEVLTAVEKTRQLSG
ncbi:MAG: Fic family protein [Gemmatimonadaceae bacterium]|nr:Fic family protein [Gemmatimonadaceae bacterium]